MNLLHFSILKVQQVPYLVPDFGYFTFLSLDAEKVEVDPYITHPPFDLDVFIFGH
jgi:hypothetical protein